jgi:hypothetical protein
LIRFRSLSNTYFHFWSEIHNPPNGTYDPTSGEILGLDIKTLSVTSIASEECFSRPFKSRTPNIYNGEHIFIEFLNEAM